MSLQDTDGQFRIRLTHSHSNSSSEVDSYSGLLDLGRWDAVDTDDFKTVNSTNVTLVLILR